jgi:hypothetical protein
MFPISCYARLADPHWGGIGVRVDIQSKGEIGFSDAGNGHTCHVQHYWLLSCPHCLFKTRELIPVPVNLGELQDQMKKFAEVHDELIPKGNHPHAE